MGKLAGFSKWIGKKTDREDLSRFGKALSYYFLIPTSGQEAAYKLGTVKNIRESVNGPAAFSAVIFGDAVRNSLYTLCVTLVLPIPLETKFYLSGGIGVISLAASGIAGLIGRADARKEEQDLVDKVQSTNN